MYPACSYHKNTIPHAQISQKNGVICPCMMSGSKVMLIINFRWKSKMTAKMAAKRTPWDNISQWEHQNSFIRQSEEYKKVS